jgi:tetratricopeptide (TPR) repeat protein
MLRKTLSQLICVSIFFAITGCHFSGEKKSIHIDNKIEYDAYTDDIDVKRLTYWFQQGYPEIVVKHAPILLARYPQLTQLQFIYAKSLFQLKKYKLALREFEKLRYTALDEFAIIGMIDIFEQEGRKKEIETLLKETVYKNNQKKSRLPQYKKNTPSEETIHQESSTLNFIPLALTIPAQVIEVPKKIPLDLSFHIYGNLLSQLNKFQSNQQINEKQIEEKLSSNIVLNLDKQSILFNGDKLSERLFMDMKKQDIDHHVQKNAPDVNVPLRLPFGKTGDDYVIADLLLRYTEGQYRSVAHEGADLLNRVPNHIELRLAVAESQMRLGKIEDAKNNLALLLDTPLSFQALLNLAQIYRWVGQTDLALKALAQAQRIQPSHPDLIAAFNQIEKILNKAP